MAKAKGSLELHLAEQDNVLRTIRNIVPNAKKKGGDNLTVTYLRGRLDHLAKAWDKCQELHAAILTQSKAEERGQLDYVTNNQFTKAEDDYLDAVDFLSDRLDALLLLQESQRHAESSPKHSSTKVSPNQHDVPLKLPPIHLNSFSGDYSEWLSFRDLFETVVHNNDSLNGVQRFQYLKTCLKGEALECINFLPITNENYVVAWELIKDRYENVKVIITKLLNNITELPRVSEENLNQLRLMRNTYIASLAALKNLDCPTDKWDIIILHILVQKFATSLKREWETFHCATKNYPTLKDFNLFLDRRISTLEATTPRHVVQPQKSYTNKIKHFNVAMQNSARCPACEHSHHIYSCPRFMKLSWSERFKLVKSKHLCFLCLSGKHATAQHKSPASCKVCRGRHHELLHRAAQNHDRSPRSEASHSGQSSEESPTVSSNLIVKSDKSVLLATALVNVMSIYGQTVTVRALLDQGSQSTLVSESLVQALKMPRERVDIKLQSLGGEQTTTIRHSVRFSIAPYDSDVPAEFLEAHVVPRITSYVPQFFDVSLFSKFSALKLADPDPVRRAKIDLLLGADVFANILQAGLVRDHQLIAQQTSLGWIITGTIRTDTDHENRVHVHHASLEPVDNLLKKFWETEEVPIATELSKEDALCEQHFVDTHARGEQGRYIVRLPFKHPQENSLGESKKIAEASWKRVERQLCKDTTLTANYHSFLKEYQELGHLSQLDEIAPTHPRVFLPHRAVIRDASSTTKLRVVFNASQKTSSGVSLNDVLMIGPKLQRDITSLILRWRFHQFVIAADIEKMFRQILIHPSDRKYQSILWRENVSDVLQPYELNTVTYGCGPAPFLANRAILQLVRDEGKRFPLAVETLTEDIYVDDVLFGADDLPLLNSMREQIYNLLASGGFNLRKWVTNHPLALPPVESESSDKSILFGDHDAVKMLGILWSPTEDKFSFKIGPIHAEARTKRQLLSEVSKIFDPLGWLSPVIIKAKGLLQSLWMEKLNWDDCVSELSIKKWHSICQDMALLSRVSLPRWNGHGGDTMEYELHGFCDASSMAYSAVVYSRVVDFSGKSTVCLLMAKAKVAPLKTLSVPRLELCGATLLVKLLAHVQLALKRKPTSVHCWSDSEIVLAWLKRHPSSWKVFVANRVSYIQTTIEEAQWAHVRSPQNPADLNSRGFSALELIESELWWHGPNWLSSNKESWPKPRENLPITVEEERTSPSHCLAVARADNATLYSRFSSWSRMLRVTAYLFKFLFSFKAYKTRAINSSLALSRDEIVHAQEFWLKYIQHETLPRDYASLLKFGNVTQQSSILNLNPIIDAKGLIRVGGRLERTSLRLNSHPFILPRHPLTKLIVRQVHENVLHGGLQLTLKVLRESYWVLNARNLVKTIIHECVPCTREKAATSFQFMRELPATRCSPSRPFTHTGVDYAGPYLIKEVGGRGKKTHKAYIAVFVCMATRAIHIELVQDYTSNAFLAALDRFVSRRGVPSVLYSDNGKTFRGADAQLQRNFAKLTLLPDFLNHLSSKMIQWTFIPPYSPHFGGLWEAGVKSIKVHLKRTLKTFLPSIEEMSTLLCKIEACVNSRPIGPLRDDMDCVEPLTPGHFLTGTSLLAVPRAAAPEVPLNRLERWQFLVRSQELFWKRWSADYLNSLQQRNKWRTKINNIKEGDIVLLKNMNLPPCKWALARVIECLPGKDQCVRVVRLRTAATETTRNVTQLCLLPVSSAT